MAVLVIASQFLPIPEASRGLANYLPLHITLEVLSIAVALMIFAIGWSTHRHARSSGVIWLSCLFLGVALLDLSHMLSYQGMPDFVTPGHPEKAINFWLAARSLAAVALIGAAFLLPQSTQKMSSRRILLPVLLLVAVAHLIFLYFPERLPRTFVPGEGLTPFKIGFEYLLIVLYLLAAGVFLLHLRKPRTFNATGLFAAAALMAMSEFFFTLYASVTDVFNLLGHLYKIVAYGFLYRALFVETVEQPWQQLKASEQQLSATIDALPDLLFELDEQGNYLQVHAAECNKLAAPAQELIGKNLTEVMPQEAADICLQAIAEAQRDGVSHGRRIQLQVPEGVRYFELSVSCCLREDNTSPIFLFLSRDETEVIEQQQALAHEASLNQSLLDLTQEAVQRNEAQLIQYGAESAASLFQSPRACIYLVQSPTRNIERLGCCAPEALPLPEFFLYQQIQDARPLMLNQADAVQALLGQTDLQRLLCLPVLEAGQVCLWVALGNKPSDYTARDLQSVQLLAQSLWQLVRRQRQDRSIETLSSALAQSPNSVIITDLNANIEYVNPAFERTSGYQLQEVFGKNPKILASGKTPDTVYEEMWERLRQGLTWQGELLNCRKDGSEFYEQVLIYPLRDRQGQIINYISHKEDISAQKTDKAIIQQLSFYDQVTDLPNRTLLQEQFERALDRVSAQKEPLTLIWLDLDNFKAINDVLGHAAGDLLLRQVADRIRAQLREQDILSRLSGDGFVLVIPGMGQDAAAVKASELLQALEPPMLLRDQEISISASLGIALYPNDASSLEGMLSCAEAAMYQVKQQGRNNFRFFAPEMQANSSRSLALSHALKLALARNELSLVYQPQFSFERQRMHAAEVLLRWQSPEWGPISPVEFIAMAEHSGLIISIGEWVMREAAKQLALWQKQGMHNLVLAINLSGVQFNQPDLVTNLARIVREEGVEPACIELELTEAVALQNPEAAGLVMHALQQAGFHLSIDDFGTGYSSMSYLKRFAVDKLKIDQSFVRELESSADDKAIVTAIIQMAQSLEMKSLAEGVETQAQADLLRELGCHEIQGYLYSRPLLAQDFASFYWAQMISKSGF